uniref:hypothetical protein n=1 Tax=Cellvibrio mixtus TaxID=39650 RepID=UPI000587CF04
QAERLIEEHYGLIAGGDLTVEFERDVPGGEAAHDSYTSCCTLSQLACSISTVYFSAKNDEVFFIDKVA